MAQITYQSVDGNEACVLSRFSILHFGFRSCVNTTCKYLRYVKKLIFFWISLRQGCTVKLFFQSISWNTDSVAFHETWNIFRKYFYFSIMKNRNHKNVYINIFWELLLTEKFLLIIHWFLYIDYLYNLYYN